MTYITQGMEDGLQDEKKTVVMRVDMENVFDRVWKDGRLVKLQNANKSHNMVKSQSLNTRDQE